MRSTGLPRPRGGRSSAAPSARVPSGPVQTRPMGSTPRRRQRRGAGTPGLVARACHACQWCSSSFPHFLNNYFVLRSYFSKTGQRPERLRPPDARLYAGVMRRLLVLVGAIVFVDTMFFAALTPLLPHYVHTLGLSKAGAGVLQAMYPAGALAAVLPSGLAAARLGFKRTVLIGLTLLAATTIAFGLAHSEWALDLARFVQGASSAFSWTGGLAWLVAASPAGRRGKLIGSAFGVAIAGAMFGPVLGAVAAYTGTGPAFATVGGLASALARAAAPWEMPAAPPEAPQPLAMLVRALSVRKIQLGVWFTLLPALLFGNLSVLGPLRLSALGWGAAAVGATYLVSAAIEAAWAPLVGHASDRYGRLPPLRLALLGSAVVCAVLPWPGDVWVLAFLIVCRSEE